MKLKTRLTKKIVDGLKYEGDPSGGSQCITWDSLIRGFGVRCFVTGVKSFILWYQFQGQRRRLTLGQFGPLTCEQARDLAVGILSKVARGIDPEAEQRQELESATMAELFEAYLQGHAIPRKRTWKEDQRRIDQYLLPALGRKKAKEVTRQHCLKLLNEIGAKHPYESNRTRALLHTVFQFAIRTGFLPETHPNAIAHIQRFKEHSRDRFIQESEMRAFLQAVDQEPVYFRAIFRLFLLTACRKTELLTLQWADVNFDRAEIRLSRTKNDEVRLVPLSGPAVQILRELPRQPGGTWVFPSDRKPGAHIAEVKSAWKRVLKRAGLTDLRPHDARRTAASWLASSGTSMRVVQEFLGHKSLATTASVYARLQRRPVEEAAQDLSGKIVAFTTIREQRKKAE
ncbi:MAG TPA: tyrosine-type recombinase/integrase [bacterium]|nr:tyrosine-type recombinase/integrase [bacterium]